MSSTPSTTQPNLMPPIIYTSERIFDPKRKEVVSQQPNSNATVIRYQNFNYGPDPMLITCPNCNHNVTTEVNYKVGTKTHTCSMLLCAAGLESCACLPYCMTSMKDALHYCPNCKSFLGKFCP